MKQIFAAFLLVLFIGCSTGDGDSMDSTLCPNPSAAAESEITATSTIVSWNSSETLSSEIEYGLSGFNQGDGQRLSVTTNSTTLSNLQPNTAYQYYLRSNCGSNLLSEWVGPQSFTTESLPCEAPYPVYILDIPNRRQSVAWRSLPNAESYTVEHGNKGFTLGTGEIINTTDTTAVIVLPFLQLYEYYIRANCRNGSTSEWFGPIEDTANGARCQPINLNITRDPEPGKIYIDWGVNAIAGVGLPENWIIEYGPVGFQLGTGITINTNDTILGTSISGLVDGTEYDFYVRGDCDNGAMSWFTGYINYTY